MLNVICHLMMNSVRRHKTLFYIFITLTVLTVLDFSPMIYQRMFGNGGSFVKFYYVDITGDNLIKQLVTYDNNLEFDVTPTDHSGYSKVQVFVPNSKEYIHMWVLTDPAFSSGTNIVFYGISDSPDFNESKIINRDYDYIFRKITIDKFEDLIIERVKNQKGSI